MPPHVQVPEEIDLFTGPHSRMKELVNIYTQKVQCVDFGDCQQVSKLLDELKNTLCEFKSHESIENLFIMDQLKNRLKQRHIYNSAVCNCHNDNRITEMMALVKNGKYLQKTSVGERLSFGQKLQEKFSSFVQQFLPHMEEEENIFQPLMVEHFEYDELRILKEVVLEQHELIKDSQYCEKADESHEIDEAIKDCRDLDENAWNLAEFFEEAEEMQHDSVQSEKLLQIHKLESEAILFTASSVNLDTEADISSTEYYFPGLEAEPSYYDEEPFPELPSEILSKIFRYLQPPDRGRCAQVCSSWNKVVYSSPLWSEVYPIQWSRGIWRWKDAHLNIELEDEAHQSPKYDEDADVDESEEDSRPESLWEKHIFQSVSQYLLPRVGLGVKVLIMDGGINVSSRSIRKALMHCPNLVKFSAAYTNVDYYSIKGLWRWNCLQNVRFVDLQGCSLVDDSVLSSLMHCLRKGQTRTHDNAARRTFRRGLKNSGYIEISNDQERYKKMKRKCCSDQLCLINNNIISDDSLDYLNNRTFACPFMANMPGSTCYCKTLLQKKDSLQASYDRVAMLDQEGIISLRPVCSPDEDAQAKFESEIEGCPNVLNEKTSIRATLEHLNLSGCYQVTGAGLLSLTNANLLWNLRSLNLSGCFQIPASLLHLATQQSPLMNPKDFTYCDNILNGPYASTANGCDSLSHPLKVCCRSGIPN